MEQENRVVVLIDMDCFYCQVEEKLDPDLKGKPIAVVQYNPWKGGGIIAVNYVARALGVTRHMRGDEAKEKCPEIQLPSVPCNRGKADITKYRDAGKEVARVLQKFTPLLERASIDEAYLDITAPVQERLKTLNVNTVDTKMMPNTYALGYDTIDDFISDICGYSNDSIEFDNEHAKWLLVGAVIVSEIRAAVYHETGFSCSAGIAHNKILAKLVCGMNKPNKQTVLPKHCINILYKTLPLKKVKHLGGKFGYTVCGVLKINNMGELQKFSEKELQAKFDEKNGTWLYNIARGIDLEPVQARFNPKTIGCCKQLRGKSALHNLDSLRKWLKDLGDEIEDRLEKDALENNRTPKQMVVSFSTQLDSGRDMTSSRSYNLSADDELCAELFAEKALELVIESVEGVKPKDGEPDRKLKAPIKFLGISVGKFEDNTESKKTRKIFDYFSAGISNTTKTREKISLNETRDGQCDNNCNKKNADKEYILQKFFQTTDKVQDFKPKAKEETVHPGTKEDKSKTNTSPVLETPLDKQESFFAKFLNRDLKNESTATTEPLQRVTEINIKDVRPTTPACNIVNHGEDSNETEYSGSTINDEINTSIALFEDDPQDVVRITNIRDLLKSTVKDNETEEIIQPKPDEKPIVYKESTKTIVTKIDDNSSHNNAGAFECPECKKIIPINKFDEHSDYHLALQLREEERLRVRKEVKEQRESKKEVKEQRETKKLIVNEEAKKRKATEERCNKNESVSSIASFLERFDDTVPTEMCSECGKKIAVEKFAEHLDFHEAQKLSRELNKKSTPSYFMGNSVKRKKKSDSPMKKSKMPCHSKSIESFFKHK